MHREQLQAPVLASPLFETESGVFSANSRPGTPCDLPGILFLPSPSQQEYGISEVVSTAIFTWVLRTQTQVSMLERQEFPPMELSLRPVFEIFNKNLRCDNKI